MKELQTYGHEPVLLCGNPTGSSLLHVYCDGIHLLASDHPAVLLDAVIRNGWPLTVSHESVTCFLALGLIPMPRSLFSEVHVLGIGDKLEGVHTPGGWQLKQQIDFPYFSRFSRQDQSPDPGRLMGLLTAATGRALASVSSPVLMLSSGKDSTALAAALARLGRDDVRCLTFVAETDQDEDGYARALCRRLGLPHERISIPAGQPLEAGVLNAFFRNAPLPCGDDCQIPYVMALHRAGGSDGVLDGSGNDVYVGHVPSRNDRLRTRLRIRPHLLATALEAVVPFGTRADQLLRSPVELCFLQGLFRRREVSRFYPSAAEGEPLENLLPEVAEALDVFDFRACVRGRHYDQGSCALKAMMACSAFGRRCLLPWCDGAVVDYYFNLPRESRFDDRTFTNKVLLREMLRREIDYPDAELGKLYFQFDRIGFFVTNQARVYDEILGCRYWNKRAAEELLRNIYRRLPRNPRVGVALNAWFLLSGWLNHNRWLNP